MAARLGGEPGGARRIQSSVMPTSARYFDLVREMKNAYNHRLRLVESVRQRGIKPTARLFATTVPTVRKWLRRFQQHGSRKKSSKPLRAAEVRLPGLEVRLDLLRELLNAGDALAREADKHSF